MTHCIHRFWLEIELAPTRTHANACARGNRFLEAFAVFCRAESICRSNAPRPGLVADGNLAIPHECAFHFVCDIGLVLIVWHLRLGVFSCTFFSDVFHCLQNDRL